MAAMMVLFFHAARLALVVFDPYLSSRPLAEGAAGSAAGQLIVDDQYYTFSSVFFYTNRRALLLNGRENNLEYGSYAPDAPTSSSTTRISPSAGRLRTAITWLRKSLRSIAFARWPAPPGLHTVTESGGKSLFTNHADLH